MRFTFEIDLALTRPVKVDRISFIHIDSCCFNHAQLDAISMASVIHNAEMPLADRCIDWEE